MQLFAIISEMSEIFYDVLQKVSFELNINEGMVFKWVQHL